jgi:uncharacterized protein YegL
MSRVQIAVVLDRSGSMNVVREPTINNFNEFIEDQRIAVKDADLRFVQFGGRDYSVTYSGPLQSAPRLTTEMFVPNGSTPLNDAIGKTVDQLGAEFSARPESDRPNKVVVLILTDGGENASKEYTQQEVAQKVRHQQDVYNWQFVFMGATEDTVLTAEQYNIPRGHALSCSVTDVHKYATGMRTSSGAIIAYTSSFDPCAVVADFSEETREAVKIDKN